MKKEVFKTGVILLVIGVIGIVIKLTYSSINEPPIDVPIKKVHKHLLSDKIKKFLAESSVSYNENVHNDVISKIKIYRKEKFLTNREIDTQMILLVEKYLLIFVKYTNDKFEASVWNESDHQKILERIKDLQTLKINQGRDDAVAPYSGEIDKIKKVIEDYREAKKISRHSVFHSVNDANEKIQKAENYAGSYPLYNCVELVNKLKAVKTKIGQSHYQKIEYQVNRMERYKRMTEEAFDTLVSRVNRRIREYNQNREKYGSDVKTMDSLIQKSREYYTRAKNYYNPSKEIKIETRYEWARSHSPSDLYRAFVSSYNHNKNNTQARMFFYY